MEEQELRKLAAVGLRAEITRLQGLLDQCENAPLARRPGRPAKTAPAGNGATLAPPRKKRTMSPAARKRISEMMKKRWADRKRQNK